MAPSQDGYSTKGCVTFEGSGLRPHLLLPAGQSQLGLQAEEASPATVRGVGQGPGVLPLASPMEPDQGPLQASTNQAPTRPLGDAAMDPTGWTSQAVGYQAVRHIRKENKARWGDNTELHCYDRESRQGGLLGGGGAPAETEGNRD